MHHEESFVLIRRLRLMSSSAASCPLTIYDLLLNIEGQMLRLRYAPLSMTNRTLGQPFDFAQSLP